MKPQEIWCKGRLVKFAPSPTAMVKLRKSNGQVVEVRISRKERRKLKRIE